MIGKETSCFQFEAGGGLRGGGFLSPPSPGPFGTLQREVELAPRFAMNVTRVRRGDAFPSRNETRFFPSEFGALNLTRVRRGIFFPSRNDIFSLLLVCMGRRSPSRRLSRP